MDRGWRERERERNCMIGWLLVGERERVIRGSWEKGGCVRERDDDRGC